MSAVPKTSTQLFKNINYMAALILIYFHIHLAFGAYIPGIRYGAEFYHVFSEHCQRPKGPQGVMYYQSDSYLPTIMNPDYRVLSVAADASYNPNPESDMYSEKLEVYIVKGRVNVINLTAPNLRSFSVIDTNGVEWTDLAWHFPKLRVLNLLSIKGRGNLSITPMGSKQLEVLRITKLDYTQLILRNIEDFKNLRVLALSQIGLSTIAGTCRFLESLSKLEHLFINRLSESCIGSALKTLAKYNTLRTAHIFDTHILSHASEICTLFPPRIEILRVTAIVELDSTSRFNCYRNLKLLEVELDSNATKIYSTAFTSLSLVGKRTSTDCPLNRFSDLGSVRVMKIRSMFLNCRQTPHLPNAEILQFTANGLRITSGVQPFPGIPRVRVLDLSDNPLGVLSREAFDKVPLLAILVLQRTEISTFEDSVFCNLHWPRIITFDLSLPHSARFRKEDTLDTRNSFRCLLEQKQATSIVVSKMICTCPMAQKMYLPESVAANYMALDNVACKDEESEMYLDFVEKNCPPPDDWSEPRGALTPSGVVVVVFTIFWVLFYLLACIPAGVLYHLHCRKQRQSITHGQLTQPSHGLFIICPRHARTWCRKVIIPCLEADLFSKSQPRLRNVKFDNAGQQRTKRRDQQGVQPTESSRETATKSDSKFNTNVNSPVDSDDVQTPEAGQNSATPKPKGPWAWFPTFHCHLAPPARHRLQLMMESKYVLIIFPSVSLFTEPACRAQLRLAFHLTRLHRIPPPAILLWPMSRRKSKIAGNYRSVNRNTGLPDHDKYYPTPEFNTVTNDPEDIAETAIIKAKIPTREEAMNILQYFSTTISPCIEWNNSKTASANLKPLVWLSKKSSRIAAY